MTKEILQRGNELFSEIQNITVRAAALESLRDEVREDKFKVRVKGLDLEIPKAVFRQQLRDERGLLEAQLSTLQAEFDAL